MHSKPLRQSHSTVAQRDASPYFCDGRTDPIPQGRQTYEVHEHTRNAGRKLTYRIAVDQWGGYHISLAGKPLRTVQSSLKCAHPYGGKQLRADGILKAVTDIELLAGMNEE